MYDVGFILRVVLLIVGIPEVKRPDTSNLNIVALD